MITWIDVFNKSKCESVNTEESVYFAILNLWQLNVAQTFEGITNLIKFKNVCGCNVQRRGAERSREFDRYFRQLIVNYCNWLNNL